MEHLRDLLDRAWVFDVQRNTHQYKKYEQQDEYQDLHGEGLGDGSLCIVGLDMHGMHNARGQITKVAVQQDRDRICFVHTVVLFVSNLMWTRRETVELLRSTGLPPREPDRSTARQPCRPNSSG